MGSNIKYKHLLVLNCEIDSFFKFGVYKIYHITNPTQFYIGSSARLAKKKSSCGIYGRFLFHICLLTNKKHYSPLLQQYFNQFGIDGLRVEVLEVCNDREHCLDREQHYLDLLSPLFNNSKSSRDSTGIRHTEECRRKRSISMKGKRLSEAAYDAVRRDVFQFSLSGDLLNKYNSMAEARTATGIDRASINNVALGNRKSAGGFLWSYTKTPVYRSRFIEQTTLTGEHVAFYSELKPILEKLNIISSNAIRNCFKGVQKQAYGFKWREVSETEYSMIKKAKELEADRL